MEYSEGDIINDHIEPHRDLFKRINHKSVIEFGLGVGTQFFLDNCEFVTSVELFTKDKELAAKLHISNETWMGKFKEKFAEYEWEVIGHECSQEIIDAELDVTGYGKVQREGNPTSDAYKKEIHELVDKVLKKHYDYAFVDAGSHLRGDIINELFDKVDVIGAHDTNNKLIYGYGRIIVPSNYRVEENPSGCGITFWIKK